MKKIVKYGILIFLFSALIGYFIGKFYPMILGKKDSDTSTNIAGDTTKAENSEEAVLETSSLEEKLLPTATLSLEKKYEDCKHTEIKQSELPVEMSNLTEDEVKEKYPDWTIKEFSKDAVTLYKLMDGLCSEHFVINSTDGIVTVYRLNENYDKTLYEKTEIYTEYLSEEDVRRLEEGIYVYGASSLNSILENFE
ncbi:MAG: hypothetical protein HFJ45_08795 [Clostridia bacterium]|nr:hypothetical protein [Clostridia bacterium]